MIDLDKLQNEAYALKVLINLIDKYVLTDREKVASISMLATLHGCIPGRAIGSIFHDKKLDNIDTAIIQEIINIYA